MAGPWGVLMVGSAAATTGVGDVDGAPLGFAGGRSGSGHHRSWRRRWQAPWGLLVAGPAAATTGVGDADSGPPGGCWR
jgi:hypothetical protein